MDSQIKTKTKKTNTSGTTPEEDPFRRSSRVRRSPPTAAKPVAMVGKERDGLSTPEPINISDLTATQSPGAATAPARNEIQPRDDVASLRNKILEEEKKVDQGLTKIRTLIKHMTSAVKKQPNISKIIKEGLPAIEDFLDDIEHAKIASSRVQELLSRNNQDKEREHMPKTPARIIPFLTDTEESVEKRKERKDSAINDWIEIKKRNRKTKGNGT